MAVHQTPRTRLIELLPLVIALLAGFFIVSLHLTRDSLWEDEGYTLGFIHDASRQPDTPGESLALIRTSLSATLARVRAVDVHPPLYYLTLDLWTLLFGDSVYMVRLFSALCALIALAATYSAGKYLFHDHHTALAAVLILATASFFVYYAREARMYALLTGLTALATAVYLRWAQRSTPGRTVFYVLTLAALLYTHYAAVWIIAAHALHSVIFGRGWRRIIPYGVAALLFMPWLPAALNQWRINGGSGALPRPSDWGAIAAWVLILTNGYAWIYALGVGLALWHWRRNPRVLVLLTLLTLLLPLALFVLNTAYRSLFQIRYTLPLLPALALLLAAGARPLRWLPLLVLVVIQLTTYAQFWPEKPRWNNAVEQAAAVRQPFEPVLLDISPYSPAAYYDRLYSLRRGIALDLGWRWQEAAEMQVYVDHLRASPSVWLAMPSSTASTWDAVTALLPDHGVGYRDSVMNMIFYRFDHSGGDDLRFRFGEVLNWEDGIGHQLYARRGEPFCLDVRLRASQPIDSSYALALALTQGYDTQRAAQTFPLATAEVGAMLDLAPCIDVPADNPPGPHHLRVQIVHDGAALPLIEADNLYWSDELFMAQVSVE